ncbi:MAG: phosphonate ABC transporter, permease protein PhnE [Bacteroidota bacterium]|nr:phosphonate ABC transporter, permease protein PhnE [Bacteroidota bacterium]
MKKAFNNYKIFFVDILVWLYIILTTYYSFFVAPSGNEFEFAPNQYYLYIIASCLITFSAHFIPNASIGRRVFHIGLKDGAKIYKYIFIYIFLITIATGWQITQVSLKDFFSTDGLSAAGRIFSALVTPEFKIFPRVIGAAVETIYMAFMATIIGIPVAFLLSFFAASNVMKGFLGKTVYTLLRAFLNISRSIEPLVWAIIFSVWVGIGPFAGMLALSIHSIASLAKLYSESIETIDVGPLEAIQSTGAHGILVVWYGIVPQVILPFISFTVYRWDINVRMATVIGLVGGGGLGSILMQYQGLAKWHEVGLIILVITCIVWAMDYASSFIRKEVSK